MPLTPIDLAKLPAALPKDLVRVLEWLRDHTAEPVDAELLAEIAGIRPRTLEAHFKLFLRCSPLAWVRRMRLARARQELLMSGPETTVTKVALSNGFTQFGRFSAQYREAFGELPSATRLGAVRSSDEGRDFDEAMRLTSIALPFAFAVSARGCDLALEGLNGAQQLAPDYGLPKAVAAWCWGQRAAHNFRSSGENDRARALHLAEDAYRLAPNDPLTITLSSGALVLLHKLEEADRRLERALALDPWLAYAWIRRGWMSAYYGDSDGALRELRTALHLMPFEPLRHITLIGIGCAHFVGGRYDQAALWVNAGTEAYPQSYWAQRVAVAAAALTGARQEARRMGRRLMRKESNLTVSQARQAWPFRSEFMTNLAKGLEIAGLPRD